ncbi:hypothetical protein [Mycolicibacter minnesotensis]|nr:MAG: hypothetical protein E6R06_03960 [Mycobacterium sp.]
MFALGIPAIDASAPHPQSHIESGLTTTTVPTTTLSPTTVVETRRFEPDPAMVDFCAADVMQKHRVSLDSARQWCLSRAGERTRIATVETRVPVPTTTEIVNPHDIVIPAPPRPAWVRTAMFGLGGLALAALLGALTAFGRYRRERPVHGINSPTPSTADRLRDLFSQPRTDRDVPPSGGNFNAVQDYPEPAPSANTQPIADTAQNGASEFAGNSTDDDGWGL